MFRKTIASPVGKLYLEADEKGLTRLGFQERADLRQSQGDNGCSCGLNRDYNERALSFINQAEQELEHYFRGELRRFNVPLHLSAYGTVFQQQVWRMLTQIPYGTTVSYGEMARCMGRPKASRAVGQASNRNPIAIIVPCHRVIGANGSLTGYAGGLEIKRFLLEMEGIRGL